jgi:hypothetical protein
VVFKLLGGVLLGVGLMFVLNAGRFPHRYHQRRVRRHRAVVAAGGASRDLLPIGTWSFGAVRWGLGGGLVVLGVAVLVVAAAR